MAAEVNKPDFSYQWASGGAIVAPSNVKVQTGWTAEVPPFQWENYLQNRQDNAILHLFQKGISEWDALSNYYFTTSGTRSYVQGSDGAIYVALQDSVGQNPISAPLYWQPAFITPSSLTSSLSLSGPTVGDRVNLVANITAASASATFNADQIVVATALNGLTYRLNSFSKAINLATTGAGGMDTGTAVVNGYVAIYAIYNPATQVSALLGVNEPVGKAPEIYGGANMPAGYTASALLTVLPTNASSQFKIAYIKDRRVCESDVTAVSTSAGVTLALLSIATSVPKSALTVSGSIAAAATSGSGGASIVISGFSTGLASQAVAGFSTSPNGCQCPFRDLPLPTAQTVWYTTALAGPGTGVFNIIIKEYTI